MKLVLIEKISCNEINSSNETPSNIIELCNSPKESEIYALDSANNAVKVIDLEKKAGTLFYRELQWNRKILSFLPLIGEYSKGSESYFILIERFQNTDTYSYDIILMKSVNNEALFEQQKVTLDEEVVTKSTDWAKVFQFSNDCLISTAENMENLHEFKIVNNGKQLEIQKNRDLALNSKVSSIGKLQVGKEKTVEQLVLVFNDFTLAIYDLSNSGLKQVSAIRLLVNPAKFLWLPDFSLFLIENHTNRTIIAVSVQATISKTKNEINLKKAGLIECTESFLQIGGWCLAGKKDSSTVAICDSGALALFEFKQ